MEHHDHHHHETLFNTTTGVSKSLIITDLSKPTHQMNSMAFHFGSKELILFNFWSVESTFGKF